MPLICDVAYCDQGPATQQRVLHKRAAAEIKSKTKFESKPVLNTVTGSVV